MKLIYLSALLLLPALLSAQPNCEYFKYIGDTLRYQACLKSEEIAGHYQFSREFQETLDEAIAIDPGFDYPYRAKSVAYLKSGDFIHWKKLMDQAVAANPTNNLAYRGWCRYQFFRDYTGAIQDIELLDSLINYDIGYSQNGNYHLHVARALCYKSLGQAEKARSIILDQLALPDYAPGIYDYLHLGVLHLELGDYQLARQAFDQQAQQNDLAENQYYLAQALYQLGDLAGGQQSLQTARKMYLAKQCMFDPYMQPTDKIYLADIENALTEVAAKEKE
ncbi:tetratricopeptide repeat protein [Flavilitoribacter nigricans]|uniref:Tetratricopeptide repeat protein n=1 Tax=Flavilitoribacter nigricans (strain ATCC 23147 / DSM 23189 / NBRC 102662 / NCIMB 1420 / SS-2) TaxID=1122177 RepID=A0A2D0NHK1_FLAN2|nr:hypothetical protein [Flavilitoribacter nigricans]PHN07984.1 hypothetical protein CRP01_04310 [Flavilitoribacter nigricans DSM 23189 = NBRC 102662]